MLLHWPELDTRGVNSRRVDSAVTEGTEQKSPAHADGELPNAVADQQVVRGTRYEMLRKLGQGGAGAVYLVRDRETQEELALKKLLRVDDRSVSRIKREFRSIADLHHPNLIELYDLGRAEDGWFITMEYLQGLDLLSHFDSGRSARLTQDRMRSANDNAAEELAPGRVCGIFQQLASGIRALHRAGILHRDLKPNNVMVVGDHVKILDLGLVHEFGESAETMTHDGRLVGTPAYMAPEQVAEQQLGEASDWYAFGVMLYEVLSGCLPIEGKLAEMLRGKLERDPTPLQELAPEAPPRLTALCMGLLHRDPRQRPGYDEISSVLSEHMQLDTSVSSEFETATAELTQARSFADDLFGRSKERALLRQAFSDMQEGRFVIGHVRGPSGVGKSALVASFLGGLERQVSSVDDLEVVVLRGRCYEREAMPFKALDGLMDALVQYLERQSDVLVSHVLPSPVDELVRAFPGLERLNVVRRLKKHSGPRANAALERTRAEDALRELIKRVSAQLQLVIWIDDLQWGDMDSASILRGWFESPEPMPLLMLLSYRSEELATSPCLGYLAEHEASPSAIEYVIDLAPLEPDDVQALCQQRLGGLPFVHAPLIGRIVEEARGNPFFASQLITLAQARLAQGEADVGALSVESVVSQASALLPVGARRLLTVLAVAGRPMTPRDVFNAAGIRSDERSLLHALGSLRLTRMREAAGHKLLEVYHDRVREAVLTALTPLELERANRSLLDAVERSGRADPDWLHQLASGAGDRAAALRHGKLAAEHADAKMAFERAADLYRACLQLMEEDAPAEQRSALQLNLAAALGNASHGARAAQVYLEAAGRESSERSVELMRLAATHLLRTGHFQEGKALVDKVLAALKIDVPHTELGLYAAIGWERTRLALRGMNFTPRAMEEIPPELIAKGVTYASLSIELQAFDPLRAALFQARCLRIALDAGYPLYISGALCAQATMTCVSGSPRDGERAHALLDRAERLAGDDELARARLFAAKAVCSFLLGHPTETVGHATEAERIYRGAAAHDAIIAGEYYHRSAVAAVRIGALLVIGRTREMIVALRSEQQEARATGNRTANLHSTMPATIADVVENNVELTRERLQRERIALLKHSFGPLHLLNLVAEMWLACATGQLERARAICDEDWPRFKGSVIRHSAYLSLLAHAWHARFLLAEHVANGRPGDPTSLLQADLRALEKLPEHLSHQAVNALNARLAFLEGDRDRTVQLLQEQSALCTRLNLLGEAAGARLVLGRMLDGAEGRELSETAEHTLLELGMPPHLSTVALQFPELVRPR